MPAEATVGAKSQSTLAFERLHADILAGRLRPAERLRIQALSERYGVGPTAIREALSRLSTNGLVVLQDQRGFCVAPVSADELADLTRARVEIESLALRQAIERGGVEWESNMLSAFHRLSKTPLPLTAALHADWDAAHVRFHEAVIAGCESPAIIGLCKLLYHKLERYRNLSERHTTQKNRDVMAEHRALLDAVMARNTKAAQALLTEHFGKTAEIVQNAVFGASRKAAPAKPRRNARQAGRV